MLKLFHDYLLTQSACFDSKGILRFGTNTPSTISSYRSFVTVLCQYVPIMLKGADLSTFLQGQLTADMRLLTNDQAIYSAHCTPKGRVFATMLLYQQDATVLAMVPADIATELTARLQKYVMFSKVEISQQPEQPIWLACGGNKAANILSAWGTPPTSALAVNSNDTITMIRQPCTEPAWYLAIHNPNMAATIWEELSKEHTPIGYPSYQHHIIDNGWADVGTDLSEKFLPQMLDLDHHGAMSLKKGCYVGQEIIARTTNLGHLKRHLYKAEVASAEPLLTPGMSVLDATDQDTGTIVNSCLKPDAANTQTILAVIADRALDQPLKCQGHTLQNIARANN